MQASELITHLQDLIEKHGDLQVVGLGEDSDRGPFSIDDLSFDKAQVVKNGNDYQYPCQYKEETYTDVFLIRI